MDYSWLEVVKKSLDTIDVIAQKLKEASSGKEISDSELRMIASEIEENASRVSRLMSFEKNREVFSKFHITAREAYLLTPNADNNVRKSLLRGDKSSFNSVADGLSTSTMLWRERIIRPAEIEMPGLKQAVESQSQKSAPDFNCTVLVLLGAGASRPLQIPTTTDFWQTILANAHSPEEHLALNMLLDTAKDETTHLPPDLEKLLSMLNKYEEYFTILWEDPLFGFPSHSLQYILPFHPIIPWSKQTSQDRFLRSSGHASIGISRIKSNIVKIMDHFYTKQINQAEVVSLYQPLFSFLNSRFNNNITIFTTNYDTAIEQYCRYKNLILIDGFQKTGANLIWNPAEYYKKPGLDQKAVTLFKLHGSLTWRKIGNEIFEFGMSAETMPGERALIYPTETKEYPNEEPFKSAYKFLERSLGTAEIAIVIGYSFRDRGITYIIDEAQSINPDLKIIVICGEDVEDDTSKRFPYGSHVIQFNFESEEKAKYLVCLNEVIDELLKPREKLV